MVYLIDERYYDAYNDMYRCEVTIDVPDGTGLPGWVGETLIYDDKGATMAAFIGIAQEKGFTTSETCGLPLDPMSGYASATDALGDRWTLGIAEISSTPDIESALMSYFTSSEWAADWAPYVLTGGMVNVEKGVMYFYDASYGFAYETNTDLELQLDALGYVIKLQSGVVASTMPTAWYEIYSFYGYYL